MESGINTDIDFIEQKIESRFNSIEAKKFISEELQPFKELMSYYSCAIMEVETKFNVLNQEMSLRYDRNPIESIKTRLKTPESIFEKLERNGYPYSTESIESNLNDIAGVRVICSYSSDIYKIAESLLSQDDIELLEKKDYIANPKESGYRSLHLIVETPIFLHNRKKYMKVEIQLRTMSMDWWASLEHKIMYKKKVSDPEIIRSELLECANLGSELDKRMERLQNIVSQENS